MNGFLLMDIGCLECHEGSSMIDVYGSLEFAKQRSEELSSNGGDWEDPSSWGAWSGQGVHAIYDMSTKECVTVRRS